MHLVLTTLIIHPHFTFALSTTAPKQFSGAYIFAYKQLNRSLLQQCRRRLLSPAISAILLSNKMLSCVTQMLANCWPTFVGRVSACGLTVHCFCHCLLEILVSVRVVIVWSCRKGTVKRYFEQTFLVSRLWICGTLCLKTPCLLQLSAVWRDDLTVTVCIYVTVITMKTSNFKDQSTGLLTCPPYDDDDDETSYDSWQSIRVRGEMWRWVVN